MNPRRSMPPPLILATLVVVAAAGCASPPSDPPSTPREQAGLPGPSEKGGGDGPRSPWVVGQWLQYEVKAATGQAGKVHAVFDGERFLADHRSWALEEATSDVPILGRFDSATLASTAFGQPWQPFDLPLADGKAWTATLPIPDEYGQPVPHPVSFVAKVGTVFLPGRQESGFAVEGRVDGHLAVESSYSPSLHLPTYLRLWTPGSNDTTWSAELREDGTGWEGTVWSASSRPLVGEHALVAPNDADPTAPYADPLATAEFAGPDPSETVFGFLVTVAFAGGSHLELIDAEGERVEATALGAPFGVDVRLVDTPGKPGTWHVAGAGAGFVAFAAAYLWAVNLRQSTMGSGSVLDSATAAGQGR